MQQLYDRRSRDIVEYAKIPVIHVCVSILILALLVFSLNQLLNINSYTDKILNIKYSQLTKETQKQVDCLTDNIYYEAGYEPEDGKVAVALVTLNRTQDPRFPKDICSVVKQRVKSTCQFSWFCEAPKRAAEQGYERARETAVHVYVNYDKLTDITGGALFYHADYVNPRWRGLEKTTVIGRHIFYKESRK
jgi:spore germination cell wall hydrolase CwlJ-like protein